MVLVRVAIHRFRKQLPQPAAEQLLPPPTPELFGAAVDVGQTPIAIERVETLAYALESSLEPRRPVPCACSEP
jgi:hypothetical protein